MSHSLSRHCFLMYGSYIFPLSFIVKFSGKDISQMTYQTRGVQIACFFLPSNFRHEIRAIGLLII